MNQTLQKALYILLLSLGLALVFNYLFFSTAIGISVFVFNVVLLGVVFGFARYQKVDLKISRWLAVPILFFAFMPAVRASDFLTFLNVITTFGLLMILAYQLNGTPVFLMKLYDYASLAVLVPFRMLGRALHTVSLLGQIHSTVKRHDVWVRVLKGALMALPVLIIFGALFSQADPAFSQFLNNIISINITERTAQYLALLAFAFVAGLSYLSYIFTPSSVIPLSGIKTPLSGVIPVSTNESSSAGRPESSIQNSGRGIETLVFLSLVACLFLLFIGFQVTYLFGGEANIMEASFTYAEYARRGFWELILIAIMSLAILFGAEKYAGTETKRTKQFLVPALVMIAEVIVVMFSAFKRLSLYIDAYSLTEPRFYVAVIIALLLVLFILLAIKFFKSKPEHFFTFSTLVSILVCLAIVNLINPDAFVAKSNIAQYTRTVKLDIDHIGSLSPDATTQKVELYNKLEGENKEQLHGWLKDQQSKLETEANHWQAFNFSRSRALKLLQQL